MMTLLPSLKAISTHARKVEAGERNIHSRDRRTYRQRERKREREREIAKKVRKKSYTMGGA